MGKNKIAWAIVIVTIITIAIAVLIWFTKKKKEEIADYSREPYTIKVIFRSASGSGINLLNWHVILDAFSGEHFAWAINRNQSGSIYVWRQRAAKDGIVTMDDGMTFMFYADELGGVVYEKVLP